MDYPFLLDVQTKGKLLTINDDIEKEIAQVSYVLAQEITYMREKITKAHHMYTLLQRCTNLFTLYYLIIIICPSKQSIIIILPVLCSHQPLNHEYHLFITALYIILVSLKSTL